MALNINDYNPTYDQARIAYEQEDYETAATLIDKAIRDTPDDPNSHLLRGHIYYVLQQYEVAQAEYQTVLYLSDEEEVTIIANNGLSAIHQETVELLSNSSVLNNPFDTNLNLLNFDNNHLEQSENIHDPFAVIADGNISNEEISVSLELSPFREHEDDPNSNSGPLDINENGSYSPFTENPFAEININNHENQEENNSQTFHIENLDSSVAAGNDFSHLNCKNLAVNFDDYNAGENQGYYSGDLSQSFGDDDSWLDDISEEIEPLSTSELTQNPPVSASAEPLNHHISLEMNHLDPQLIKQSYAMASEPDANNNIRAEINSLEDDDNLDMELFESAFGADNPIDFSMTFTPSREVSENFNTPAGTNSNSPTSSQETSNKNNVELLNNFDEFDDIGDISGFELRDETTCGDVGLMSEPLDMISKIPDSEDNSAASFAGQFIDSSIHNDTDRDEELFRITGAQEVVPGLTQSDTPRAEPNVSFKQGLFGFFENAPLHTKHWYIAGTVGLASAIVLALASAIATSFTPASQREAARNTGWLMVLAAGLTGGATAGFMANLTLKQIRRTTQDLQAQFDAVRQGKLNVEATVYSEDELGYLAAGFNDMARVIFTTTNEAQRKAIEQEEAKENLQRQVIRLLDDVEGAARGDLTVQAEVTTDVLGEVADAFNLTIQNLRDIVQQVKFATKDVTRDLTNSETFARALSRNASQQAEELKVTLNSVEVMTDSIQRVAEAAREAAAVTREASDIAKKGGESVENTVVGILEIRETVAKTSRKVKRLAESSQEISSIVAIVSQIASRTNLLALNASIEAARAGEAGRGFAIVADEVRQLAYKSAKSLKEIDQIVMQIQSETSSVMMAMEEGTQQVIHQTELAEEAKRSLDDIIQVVEQIDILVRSITTDTVEQTETSHAVAQVMQSVELTAQEASQEAQRVLGALQHLVGVSRDLIASVERFRVETIETR
ncbi:HAMP domain-containing protein [Anabaena sp. FACHB-1237]|uniref:methyl-accepting chemotaxis protein n=1 Tax=Anabaena sp. FACHB-1237 TaxID=2692769 RepID=UPI00168026C0|nr:methyl-accepting chemotaxis protein [Anabaena sp. FACHB-1237]MBD2136403.1 HAMP domain-containing protein [Anabaena sp. FACHB-1237]